MMLGHRPAPDKGFAETPCTEQSQLWQQWDQQLPSDHLAREIRETLTYLDLKPLYESYAGRGKDALPPELLLAMVLFEIRRGRHKPAQWFTDSRENIALKWLGLGLQPSRSCLYAFRDRLTPYLDGWNQQVLAQAQAKDLTTAQSGALDGSTVASAGSRRQLFHRKRLDKRLQQLRQACQADALAQSLTEPPSWLAHSPQARQEQRRRYETAAAAFR